MKDYLTMAKSTEMGKTQPRTIELRVKILELIDENPAITIEELSERLYYSSRSIQRHIRILYDKGLLIRQEGKRLLCR